MRRRRPTGARAGRGGALSFAVLQDVTDSRRAEEGRNQLFQAVEQSPVGVIIASVSGRIEYVNVCFSTLSGYAPEEPIGCSLSVLDTEGSESIPPRAWGRVLDGGLDRPIAEILEETGFPASRLELEVTESLLIAHSDEIMAEMNSLKSRGITLTIDDFGTGYSALSYLKRYNFNALKIDRGFVCDVPRDPDAIPTGSFLPFDLAAVV